MGDHKTRWMNGKPSLQPSDVFRRNFWIVPFFEDDMTELVATIGASQILNGSDFPHLVRYSMAANCTLQPHLLYFKLFIYQI